MLVVVVIVMGLVVWCVVAADQPQRGLRVGAITGRTFVIERFVLQSFQIWIFLQTVFLQAALPPSLICNRHFPYHL